MLGTALYYPHIDIHDGAWLRSAILFWDEIQTIVPTSIRSPYKSIDTKICEEEGYLRPLRCDLHPELLDDLGRRVIKLLENPEWQNNVVNLRSEESSASTNLIQGQKIIGEMKSELEDLVGIHLDKIPAGLLTFLIASEAPQMLSGRKASPHLKRMLQDFEMYQIHPAKFSYEMRRMLAEQRPGDESEWVLVSSRFAEVYMSALAALLSKEVQVSALTNEKTSSGVNLHCLIDDVAASGDTAARGALVSVVMKGLKVDPQASLKKLISFRRSRKDQIAELSALFDELKGKIEKSSSPEELHDGAQRLFENKIHPSLEKLKSELSAQSIQSVWDGIQRGFTVSAAGGSALAYITGYTGPMLLGAAAFLTIVDVSVKSYLARSKTRVSSPYTYLLDVESRFSLPR